MNKEEDDRLLSENAQKENSMDEESWKGSLSIESYIDDSKKHSDNVKGVILMILASLSFGLMAFSIKLSYQKWPGLAPFDVLIVRSTMMIPLYYVYGKILKVNFFDINFDNAKILFLRCIFGAAAMSWMFAWFRYLPASIGFMIFNMNPIFVLIMAYLFLNEKLSKTKIICWAGAFIGVVLVGIGRKSEKNNETLEIIGIILAFFGALLASLAYIWMRKINTVVHYIFSPYYLAYCSFCVCALAYIYDSNNLNPERYGMKEISYWSLWGLLSLVGQLLLSAAYKYSNASTLSPIMYLNCISNIFTDLLYFKLDFYYTDLVGGTMTSGWVILPVLLLVFKNKQHSSE